MSAQAVVTRFAPSPTGRMHLGNARTALFNYLAARRDPRGAFRLRIEDTDAERSRPEFTSGLREDLRWLGLAWDGDEVHQSARRAAYDAALDRLLAADAAYPCFCTPAELDRERAADRAAARAPRYSGRCRALSAEERQRRLAAGDPAALRFRVPESGEVAFDDVVHGPMHFRCAEIGDFVLRRTDGSPAFFFGNALDDSDGGITLVLRGEDHLANTPRQLLLLGALGRTPPRYGHLSLLMGGDGQPLSKRGGAASVAALRDRGYLPAALLNLLFRLGHHGASDDLLDLPAMAAAFDVHRLQRASAQLDPVQLDGWQKRAAHALSAAERLAWLAPELPASMDEPRREAFVAAVAPNVVFPADVRRWLRVVEEDDVAPEADARAAVEAAPAALFAAAAKALDAPVTFKQVSGAAAAATGLKGPALFRPLRAALTGRLDGPELGALLPLIGTARARSRLARFA